MNDMHTTCPSCHAVFRVTAEQLKVRAGLVRCGKCAYVFNAFDTLVTPIETVSLTAPQPEEEPEDLAGPPARPEARVSGEEHGSGSPFTLAPEAQRVPEETPAVAPTAPADAPAISLAHGEAEGLGFAFPTDEQIERETEALRREIAASNEAAARAGSRGPAAGGDAPVRESLPAADTPRGAFGKGDEEAAARAGSRGPAAGGDGKEAVAQKPGKGPGGGGDAQVPGMDAPRLAVSPELAEKLDDLKQQLAAQERRARWRKAAWSVATLAALLAGAIQGMYFERDRLAVRAPAVRPALEALCRVAGCRLGLPREPTRIELEASELAAEAAGGAVLSATLRNTAPWPVAYPHLQLTLTDGQNRPVARRHFSPEEYLGRRIAVGGGMPPGEEINIRLPLELYVAAEGYKLLVYYPDG